MWWTSEEPARAAHIARYSLRQSEASDLVRAAFDLGCKVCSEGSEFYFTAVYKALMTRILPPARHSLCPDAESSAEITSTSRDQSTIYREIALL